MSEKRRAMMKEVQKYVEAILRAKGEKPKGENNNYTIGQRAKVISEAFDRYYRDKYTKQYEEEKREDVTVKQLVEAKLNELRRLREKRRDARERFEKIFGKGKSTDTEEEKLRRQKLKEFKNTLKQAKMDFNRDIYTEYYLPKVTVQKKGKERTIEYEEDIRKLVAEIGKEIAAQIIGKQEQEKEQKQEEQGME